MFLCYMNTSSAVQSPLDVTFGEVQITQLSYSGCPRVSPFPIIINHAPSLHKRGSRKTGVWFASH